MLGAEKEGLFMPKPILAVDFDDVLAGFQLAFMHYHNEQYGTTVTYEGITSYWTHEVYETTPEVIGARIMDFCAGHHDTVMPIEGALESLRALSQKYNPVVVTSRCESLRPVTYLWKERRSFDMFANAHFTNNFETKFPELRRSKSSVCKEIGAVALIDDAASHANEVAWELNIPVFLPDRPWNRTELHPNVTRVAGWDDIVQALMD
jgi:uncharacterized HAD superfamily protein